MEHSGSDPAADEMSMLMLSLIALEKRKPIKTDRRSDFAR
jgi:hypothetical protein